jgi:hypothetical protein
LKKLFILILSIITVVIIYFVFFSPSGDSISNKRIALSDTRYINPAMNKGSANKNEEDMYKSKLSMKQIDSITASQNYGFTIDNYYKDVEPIKAAAEKTKKI